MHRGAASFQGQVLTFHLDGLDVDPEPGEDNLECEGDELLLPDGNGLLLPDGNGGPAHMLLNTMMANGEQTRTSDGTTVLTVPVQTVNVSTPGVPGTSLRGEWTTRHPVDVDLRGLPTPLRKSLFLGVPPVW